jgi:hypothetical protein
MNDRSEMSSRRARLKAGESDIEAPQTTNWSGEKTDG